MNTGIAGIALIHLEDNCIGSPKGFSAEVLDRHKPCEALC